MLLNIDPPLFCIKLTWSLMASCGSGRLSGQKSFAFGGLPRKSQREQRGEPDSDAVLNF